MDRQLWTWLFFLGCWLTFSQRIHSEERPICPMACSATSFMHTSRSVFLTGNSWGTICGHDSPGLLHSANCSFETFSSVHVLNFTKCHQSTLAMSISGRTVKNGYLLLTIDCKALPDRPGSCSNRNSPWAPLIWRVENSFSRSRRLYVYNTSCRRLQESHHCLASS